MTGFVMNGQAHDCFPARNRARATSLVVALGLGLAGCASGGDRMLLSQTPVDPQSPAGPAIQSVLQSPGDFPGFSAIPQAPTDLDSTGSLKAKVAAEMSAGQAVAAEAAPATWTLGSTEAFASLAIADANASGLHPPTPAEIAESEAFAKALRARAKPPSRPR
jgi:hypothetical protein